MADRQVLIRYSTNTGEPDTFEVVKFPAETTDDEIDQYCYDVVDYEYSNQRWFDWTDMEEKA